MNIFEFRDYKKYVATKLKTYPSNGRGQLQKIAEHLRAPPSTLSNIFNGDRDLTFEQASDLAEYFGLSKLESEFLLVLVEKSRAGCKNLQKIVEDRLEKIKAEAQEVKGRIVGGRTLGENEKNIFYSEWYFSAVRLLTSVPAFQTAPDLAAHLGLPIQRVNEVLAFLVNHGLCVEERGRYAMGPMPTHVAATDPLVFRHHRNWREQTGRKLAFAPQLEPFELCFTMPCSMSKAGMEKVRKELMDCISSSTRHVDDARPDFLACMTVDLVKL